MITKKKKILIVSDDPKLKGFVGTHLSAREYEITSKNDIREELEAILDSEVPDLVILDLMLPKMNGYELCRRVRGEGITTPILMLTARGEEVDRVMGLDLGADDYVTKPFSVPELLARVRAMLRRVRPAESLPPELGFDDVVVDFLRYEAQKGGKPLRMSRKEFGILRLLAAQAGQVVTREDLLNEVWGYENYPSTRTVDNHIASLRAKLEEDPSHPRRLLTVHGVGYKLVM